MKTSIEITDQEYLIKLNKKDFDLAFINQLLKRIQDEQTFFSKSNEDNDASRQADKSTWTDLPPEHN